MSKVIFILLTVLLIILLIILIIVKNNKIIWKNTNINIHNPMWIYWDDLNGENNRPAYISLCIDTIKKNSYDFTLIILNKNNINEYLPELEQINKIYNLEKLLLAQRVDIYRIMLLYKYGGFYLDADTILLSSPIKLYNLLDKYDYIGYGCTGNKCFPEQGYKNPSNGIMISRKKTKLMLNIFNNIINKLQSNITKNIDYKQPSHYFDFGKYAIWDELKNHDYYHITSEIGIRDTNGYWVTADRLFSNEDFKFYQEDKLLMVVLYNNMMDDLKNISKHEILNNNWRVSYFFNKTLINKY